MNIELKDTQKLEDTQAYELEDTQAREQALDPTQSFIVQAPAGSGKTELLTQRYLRLLSHVSKAPEEILAVTFTRKAQGEMRERILLALARSKEPEPEAMHEKKTWQLAKKVQEHGERLGWDLILNPNRLRIMTIDALAALLVHRLPILSKFGTEPNIQPHIKPLIREAITQFFLTLQSDDHLSQEFSTLLYHMDNRLSRLEDLLMQLLLKRDQWLNHVVVGAQDPQQTLDTLESSLKRIVEKTLNQTKLALTDEALLVELAQFAAQQLHEADLDEPGRAFKDWTALPGTTSDHLPAWQAFAQWVLTKDGDARKSITKNQGFPAPSRTKDKTLKALYKSRKDTMMAWLEELKDSPLEAHLRRVLQCPEPQLSEDEAAVLKALFRCLPILVAHLKLLFKQRGVVDFVEVAEAALMALGDEESPTDVALSLDYQIQHILIDEFQDTSVLQFELFEKLIRGWEPGDGRTLFLVGDPQQSIYRFRGAEVGLFLRALEHGLGGHALQFLKLRKNFRSEPHLCEWVNTTFGSLFPKDADISLGAIPLSHSLAHQQENTANVECYLFEDSLSECSFIAQSLEQNQTTTAAVLVRARTHLIELIPMLKALRVPFHAMEIESMNSNRMILDLLALTQAIVDPTHRIAWLAVLRAPWCGLSMQDLWVLAHDSNKPIIKNNLWDEALCQRLSADGQLKIQNLKTALEPFFAHAGRSPFADWLQGLWLQLGGPACYPSLQQDHELYFNLLSQTDVYGLQDWSDFESQVLEGFIEQEVTDESASLELMTIHKSKGLEFDTVFMPRLHKKPRNSHSELLLWQERPYDEGVDLLMAPIKSPDQSDDKLYHYLKGHVQEKDALEAQRLFYVGTTRAKKRLVLTGTANITEDGELKPPAPSSFLGMLDDTVYQQFILKQNDVVDSHNAQHAELLDPHWRWSTELPSTHQTPIDWDAEKNIPELHLGFESKVGTLVHRLFQTIAQEGVECWLSQPLEDYKPAWEQALLELGVLQEDLQEAYRITFECVSNVLHSEKGQWILSAHDNHQNEYAMLHWHINQVKTSILDRTWHENGERWIIDYKVVFNDADAQGEHYLNQLHHYARLFKKSGSERIQLGVYFPLQDRWWQQTFSEHSINEVHCGE